MRIFQKHGLTNIDNWITKETEGVQPRLLYTFPLPSEQVSKTSFDTFRVDPEWIKVKVESKKKGNRRKS